MSTRRPPMRHCDECRFADLRDQSCYCAHGHKPAFVMPDWSQIHSGDWGWMLRCRDFKPTDEAERRSRATDRANEQREVELHEQRLSWRQHGEALLSTPQTSQN